MRQAFAEYAELEMAPGGDIDAPGAAVTVELCGHWEHQPPCPVAAHHTAASRDGDVVRLRVLFATEPEREAEVRQRIGRALRGGTLAGPHRVVTRWRVRTTRPGAIAPDDADHAVRLAVSP
jgi:hypothetical protein